MGELTRKLHPTRFPGMSPLMAAVVGYVVVERSLFNNLTLNVVPASAKLAGVVTTDALGNPAPRICVR